MSKLNDMFRKAESFAFRNLPLMITCGEFEEFVIDYFDGSLSSKQKFVFETHLKVCSACRSYLSAYRRTVQMGKAAFASPDEALPEDVPEDLVRAILDARTAPDSDS